MSSTATRRTIVYIDGFNLYFGLVKQGWRKYRAASGVISATEHFRKSQFPVVVSTAPGRSVTKPPSWR
jgi:hypothetical protein